MLVYKVAQKSHYHEPSLNRIITRY